MLIKINILTLISLSLQILIKAELPRNVAVNSGRSIDQRFEALEREINKLKTDNRYLLYKLEKFEQKAGKLEQEIEIIKQTANENNLERFLNELKKENAVQQCLKEHLEQLAPQTSRNDEQNSTRNSKNYDEHFNCIENCGNTSEIPRTCAEALAVNRSGDGIYQIYAPNSTLKPFYVYCLQDAYGDNAWMVIQRRQSGQTIFVRNWSDYAHGFGDLYEDYWLGLKRLHALTSARKYELWIQLKDHAGMGRYASYNEFAIADEQANFKLIKLGDYDGDAGNSLVFNYEAKFSTYDRDNDDVAFENCAEKRMSAWWFKDCEHSLNGLYNSSDYGTGVNWIGWHDYRYSLKYVHIAIRPVPVEVVKKTPMVFKPIWYEA